MDLGGLWEAVEAALEGAPKAASLHEARVQLLRAWRRQPHPRLADLVEACDLPLDRTGDDIRTAFLSSDDPQGEYLYRALWRTSWAREGADLVAKELLRFERCPDPALTTVVLELARAAPPQLMDSHAVWSAAAQVLVAAGDIRAIPSLERFLDSPWPYGGPETVRCCVPHLERALQHLKGLPRPPALEVPPGVAGRLAAELAAVAATTLVSPMDPAEELAQLERYVASPSVETRAVLGDWLGERGDPRGGLLRPSAAGVADDDRECLEARLEPRWLARAPSRVTGVEFRAGLPWAARLDFRKKPATSDFGAWPPWRLIESVDAFGRDEQLLPALCLAPALRHLSRVSWHDMTGLPDGTLARLETMELLHLFPPEDAEGSAHFLSSRLPSLTSLCLLEPTPALVRALRPMPALGSLTIWVHPSQLEELLEALAHVECPVRIALEGHLSHTFWGARHLLQAETTTHRPLVADAAGAEFWMQELAPARRVRQRLGPEASWTLDPALEARYPEVAAWWRAPAGA